MLAKFQSYIIIGLTLLFIACACGWIIDHRFKSSKIEELNGKNAQLELSVQLNEKTIEGLKDKIEKNNNAYAELMSRTIKSESNFASEWKAIEDLDFASDLVSGDPLIIEKKVNNEFEKSIQKLRDATSVGVCAKSDSVCKHETTPNNDTRSPSK